jgi:hypothetical protein
LKIVFGTGWFCEEEVTSVIRLLQSGPLSKEESARVLKQISFILPNLKEFRFDNRVDVLFDRPDITLKKEVVSKLERFNVRGHGLSLDSHGRLLVITTDEAAFRESAGKEFNLDWFHIEKWSENAFVFSDEGGEKRTSKTLDRDQLALAGAVC